MTATLYWRPLRELGEVGPEPAWSSESFADAESVDDVLASSIPSGDWLYRVDYGRWRFLESVELGDGSRIDALHEAFHVAAWVVIAGRVVLVPEYQKHAKRSPVYERPSPDERSWASEWAQYERRVGELLRDAPSWPNYRSPVDWFHAYTMPACDPQAVYWMARSAFGAEHAELFWINVRIAERVIGALVRSKESHRVAQLARGRIETCSDFVRGNATKADVLAARRRADRELLESSGRVRGIVLASLRVTYAALNESFLGSWHDLSQYMPRAEIHGLMPVPESGELQSAVLCEWIREAAPFDAMARAMIERGEWK